MIKTTSLPSKVRILVGEVASGLSDGRAFAGALALSAVQLLLPLIVATYGLAPYLVDTKSDVARAWVFFGVVAVTHLMLGGLIVRLLARPSSFVTLSPWNRIILKANHRLVRVFPGSSAWKAPELKSQHAIFLAEVYPYSWWWFGVGVVVSLVLQVAVAGLSLVLLFAVRQATEINLLLVLGMSLFVFNLVLLVYLRFMREYWSQELQAKQ